jgi:uncharacterized protein YndB with AHSA1/START domain
MASFTLHASAAAPPEVVFDVLTDHRGYTKFKPFRSATLEREGDPPPNGVGAIRALGAAPGAPPLREEVLVYEPPTRFSYRLISGAPVRDHVGTVTLEPEGQGTRITYYVETTPKVPLVGGALVGVVKATIGSLLKGIVAESERRAAAPAG